MDPFSSRAGQQYVVASLLDRLLDDDPNQVTELSMKWRYTLDEYKNSVARDLEWLLNTRLNSSPDLEQWSELGKSLSNYGLPDFSSLSALSEADKLKISQHIQTTISIFEPRLRQVLVHFLADTHTQFNFRIEAWLYIEKISERVMFDAMLEVTTQLYKVK